MKRTVDFIKKNTTISLCITVFTILFLIMTVFWISKKGTFSIDDENSIKIECPSVFGLGKTIECDISLVMADSTKVYSINANYDLGEGVTYESFGVDNTECTGEGCLDALEVTENGFTVINVDGFIGSIAIGKLRVTMPSEALPNTDYKIGLKDIELVYDENGEPSDEMMTLADTFTTSRTGNNVATLASLSLEGIQLDKEFDSNTFKYSATVDDEVYEAIINYELSDPNASVLEIENSEHLWLDYGNNTFYIAVVSEDESVTNTYEISIYRNYEFSTSVYKYDKENNYIYTGTDKGYQIINNIEQLHGGDVRYELNNDNSKLLIVFGEGEVLLNIDIINFDIDYEIIDKKIYINSNLTYGELLDTINGDNISVKLFDSDNNEITRYSTEINENYKLNIYYGDTLLDSFGFVKNYLKINESLVVDNQNMMIKRLKLGTTYGEFREYFYTTGTISFISSDDEVINSEDAVLKTGDIIRIKLGNDTIEYTLSVLGDINGNGTVKINDVGTLFRFLRNKVELDPPYAEAGDVVGDGIIKINDVGKLFRYMRNKISSLDGDE